MTQKQKILGGAALLFLVIAIVISASPSEFLQRSSSSAGSYTPTTIMNSLTASDAVPRSEMMRLDEETGNTTVVTNSVSEKTFGKKIIKNAELFMQVESVDATTASLHAIAQKYDGDVTSEDFSQYSPSARLRKVITFKVTSDTFEAALTECKTLAEAISSESISTDDVTSDYIDLEARLKNAYAEEASYVAVLAKATSVEDILSVQSYLSQVRGEIESMEARKTYLDSQTSYSTITVTFSEDTRVTLADDTFRPWQTIVDAAQTVVKGSQVLVLVFLRLLIVGGAILLPLGLLGFTARIIWRRVRK